MNNHEFSSGFAMLTALSLLILTSCAHQPVQATTPASLSREVQSQKPKYSSKMTPLADSHEFIQQTPAVDYWRISPYYVAQQTGSSCSVAATTMVVNAARDGKKLGSEDPLVTHGGLLERVGDPEWTKDVSQGGSGVSLDRLKRLVEKSLRAYGVRDFQVKSIRTRDTSEQTRKQLHDILVENERSSKNFIIANFNQGVFTDDGSVGHFAPVAAYDEQRGQVLIMDPDRAWYEPYWVSEETFLKGMATEDPDTGRTRGYLWITIGN